MDKKKSRTKNPEPISGKILRTREAGVSSEVSVFVDTRFITLTKL